MQSVTEFVAWCVTHFLLVPTNINLLGEECPSPFSSFLLFFFLHIVSLCVAYHRFVDNVYCLHAYIAPDILVIDSLILIR
jgi:hypothetical protein